jgi:hypothetical protein
MLEHEIIWFYVSVSYVVFVQEVYGFQDLLHQLPSVLFVQGFHDFHALEELVSFEELLHQNDLAFGCVVFI